MKHSEQIKLIRQAFDDLSELGLQDGFYYVVTRLFDMNVAAERQHRTGSPYGIKHGLGVMDAAKLFTVSHLLDAWNKPNRFSVDDILNIRTEVLYAQAYASRHLAALSDWANKYTEPFKQVDYAQLQRGGQR